jgi:hypothetical protein
MKARTLFTTLAASLLFAGAALADGQIGWNTYHDDKAAFTVEMPGEAKMSTEKVDGGMVYHLDSATEKMGLHVASFDAAQDLSGSEKAPQILDNLRDSVLKEEHASAQSERDLRLNGFPGREFTYQGANHNSYWVTRFFLVKSHIFTLEIQSADSGIPADGTRFFNSFQPEIQ